MPRPAPDVKITLRLPAELHEALVKAAAGNRRSLNSEIVVRLEASTEEED